MSDPQRLLDGGGTDFECNLLSADRAETPNAFAKRRAAVALAIGTASVWPTAAAATTKASKVGVSLIVKLLAIGAVGAGAWGTAQYLRSRPEPAPVIAKSSTAPVVNERATDDTTARTTPTETVTPFESLERERPVEAARRAPSTAGAAASAPVEGASISNEIRMLDAARRAQAGGDAAGAIRALDDYQRQYPRGALAEESVLIRIEALARLGNGPAARALAQRFRATHPNSPHLRRIDSVLAEP
jgi:hypothetical protein